MAEAAVIELVKTFTAASNHEHALAMQAYMKGKFPFLGVKAPERNVLYKNWKAHYLRDLSTSQKMEIVQRLWELPEREYAYLAIEILTTRKKAEYCIEDLVVLEHLIVTNSWWDTVDLIASNAVGVYFSLFPAQIPLITRRWMASGNIWLQRTCLLFQLKYRHNTDFELLKEFIIEVKEINEFFLQKAIGWSLRQYSKTNKIAVLNFIAEIKLTGLARREASKYLN